MEFLERTMWWLVGGRGSIVVHGIVPRYAVLTATPYPLGFIHLDLDG